MATKTIKTKTCKNGTWCLAGGDAPQPVANFHRYNRSTDGYKSECKTCRLDYQRDYDASNTDARATKRKVYANFFFTDQKQIAFNYLAKQLGVKAKVTIEGTYADEGYRAITRNLVKKTFTTKAQKATAFNLISYQLGQNARA